MSILRSKFYAYDPHFDFLTGVSYNDGLANSNQNWTYDAAGNRISDTAQAGTWSYDNLNRMAASPGATYMHDVVGNRTRRIAGGTTTDYGWDTVNRMTAHVATTGTGGHARISQQVTEQAESKKAGHPEHPTSARRSPERWASPGTSRTTQGCRSAASCRPCWATISGKPKAQKVPSPMTARGKRNAANLRVWER